GLTRSSDLRDPSSLLVFPLTRNGIAGKCGSYRSYTRGNTWGYTLAHEMRFQSSGGIRMKARLSRLLLTVLGVASVLSGCTAWAQSADRAASMAIAGTMIMF